MSLLRKRTLTRPTKKDFTLPTYPPSATVTFIGLDISLSATGIAEVNPDGVLGKTFTTKATEPTLSRCKRIADKLSGSRLAIVEPWSSVVFVREDYAYGAQGVADVLLKELGGIVKMAFFEGGHELHAMPIGSWKKFVTGKGNATKLEVEKAIRTSVDFKLDDWTEHTFDAYGVAVTAKALACRKSAMGLTSYQKDTIDSLVEKSSSLVLLDV